MVKFTPAVRSALIIVAAVVGGLVSVQDQLPEWVQLVVTVAAVALAGVGIVPPHIPTRTVVRPRAVHPEKPAP